ncbi:TniB family NTP-binding protein [Dankookia sp. P2]|uniref:TniB family NTP-binding protein n=1 Tax=Dankookia sp. P2 TaxID=3423955 RepID=UPI003D66C797
MDSKLPRDRAALLAAVSSLRGIFTPYPRLDRIKSVITRLLSRGNAKSEGAVYTLVGETGAGKSHLLRLLESEHPRVQGARDLGNGDFADYVPVLLVKVPNASVRLVAEAIFKALTGQPVSAVLGAKFKKEDVLTAILRAASECDLKIMILDEAHQSIDLKTDRVAQEVAVLLKDLANARIFSLLVVGTEGALRLIRANAELARRAHKTLRIEAFRRSAIDLEIWYDILHDIDEVLENRVFGRKSNLDSPDMAEALMTAANGFVGHMAALVENAANEAVEEMLERDTEGCVRWEHLELAFSEWGPGEGRVNPFSPASRPPNKGSPLLPDCAEDTATPETVMSGVKGRGRRNDKDSLFRK